MCTGARASARAAHRPANPPPTMTTCGGAGVMPAFYGHDAGLVGAASAATSRHLMRIERSAASAPVLRTRGCGAGGRGRGRSRGGCSADLRGQLGLQLALVGGEVADALGELLGRHRVLV